MFAGSPSGEPLYDADFVVDATSNTLTIAGSQVLTTATLTVNSGDPWVFNGGTELQGVGGTWETTDQLTFDGRPYGTTADIGFQGDCPADAAPFPSAPSVPFVFWSPANNNVGQCYDTDLLTTVSFDRYSHPDSFLDIGSTPSATLFYRFTPDYLQIIIDGGNTYLGNYFDFPGLSGSPCTIRAAGLVLGNSVSNGITVQNGSVVARDNNAAFGTPQVQNISGIDGGIAGEYLGADDDCHVGHRFYVNDAAVVGYGAQHFGHIGAFIVSTNGDGTTPTAGFARLSVWNDAQGTRYRNTDSPLPNRGSIADWHLFDETIATSGSLETSSTINIQGTCEGLATIASGGTSVTISTSAVTSSDTIPLSYPSGNNSGGAPWIEQITSGTNFVINTTGAVTTDTLINWKLLH